MHHRCIITGRHSATVHNDAEQGLTVGILQRDTTRTSFRDQVVKGRDDGSFPIVTTLHTRLDCIQRHQRGRRRHPAHSCRDCRSNIFGHRPVVTGLGATF